MTSHNRSGFRRIPVISPDLTGFVKPAEQVRLTGVVRPGVERGSVVLLAPDGRLLAQLMGGDPVVLFDGAQVTVTGQFVADLLTTVQQGRPFRVTEARGVEPDGGQA